MREQPAHFRTFLAKLRKRHIIETFAGFIAGGWLFLEFVDRILIAHYELNKKWLDVSFVTLLGALLCIILWRWFSGTEKRPGNVKVEVLLVPLIILASLCIDLNIVLDIAGVSGMKLLTGIIALCLGIAWIIFKSLQWAAQAPGMREREFSLSKLVEIKPEKSIVVLPFVNISPEEGQDYFCDGMTEELITDLSHVHALIVISRSSAMTFKRTKKKVGEIAQELNVRYVLEGSVRKAGNDLRITAQLIDSKNDAHIWAEKYAGTLNDVFDIQEKVSCSIVNALKLKLLEREKTTVMKRPTGDVEAYELYMRGRFLLSQVTAESLARAIDYFNRAVKRDASFALAYSGIAESYVWLCMGAGILPPIASMREAKEAALKAVELGPDLAETYTALATVATFYDWDRDMAGESFNKALELNPNAADTLMWYAAYLIILEHNFEEALGILRRALELNPLQNFIYSVLSWAYLSIPQFDRLIEEIKKLQSLDPLYWYSYHMLGESYLGKRMYEDARANYEEAVRRGGRAITNIAELGFTQALDGKTNEAMELLTETKEASYKTNMFYGYVGLIYIGLGQYDYAFEWIEKASKVHDIFFLFLPSVKWPGVETFCRDPRFRRLLEKVGLTYLVPKS